MNDEKLIPVTEWHKFHAWPPYGGLRHLIHYSDENGFDKVIRRIGGRVLISEKDFFKWVKENSDIKIKEINKKRKNNK
jgi:hypothetical protein